MVNACMLPVYFLCKSAIQHFINKLYDLVSTAFHCSVSVLAMFNVTSLLDRELEDCVPPIVFSAVVVAFYFEIESELET